MNRRILASTLAAFFLSACAHAPASQADAPLVTPSEVPWKEMTGEQKGRYMKKVVTPKMRELFQAYDAKEFAEFDCKSCHGKTAKAREFKMPTPDLPELPSSPDEFMATTMKEHPEMVKFMGEQVTPKMAELLGLKAFDHQHPDPSAFSCHGCHTLTGVDAPK